MNPEDRVNRAQNYSSASISKVNPCDQKYYAFSLVICVDGWMDGWMDGSIDR